MWHFNFFVNVFEKCKDETLSKLYNACIYFTTLTKFLLFNLDITKNMKVH